TIAWKTRCAGTPRARCCAASAAAGHGVSWQKLGLGRFEMLTRLAAAVATLALIVTNAAAQTALTGIVSSAEESVMEGVLVSAKKADSTITVTVVSDRSGRYSFPASKLSPGSYALKIRAVGYDLDNGKAVEVAAGGTATHDLKLRKTEDLAAQLTNAEW